MTVLRRMQAGSYPPYLEAAILGYAQENVAAGRWPQTGSVERSREDFEALLPLGLDTPGNFLFEMLEDEGGPVVGFVWYAMERKHGSCAAYIYDLEVKSEHRRRGHAWNALQLLQLLAARDGATSVGLNVFANNLPAQALYSKLGYVPTNINMRKPLEQTAIDSVPAESAQRNS